MQENNIILYQDDNEITRVSVRFADEDLWLTQNQLADIYCTTQQNISQHVDNIYKDGELTIEATNKKFLLVRQEGNRQVKRNIDHYNLDMIIALGYRVQSQVATRFRRWATQRLHEYIQKGFAMDDERLKQGGNRYFRELLQRIRDIRSSERNFYQQVTDIYATATDYDPRDEMTKIFFATVQNKLHYAVHENTAAEVIYNRVDNEKPFVGMTNFKGNYVTKDDVKIAKNYLSEIELQRLNLLVSGFLDFAEFQALEMNPMTMKDWIEALDNQIIAHKRKVLIGKGNISHKQAIEKAEKEFEIYRKREMELLESDFDKAIKRFKAKSFQHTGLLYTLTNDFLVICSNLKKKNILFCVRKYCHFVTSLFSRIQMLIYSIFSRIRLILSMMRWISCNLLWMVIIFFMNILILV